MYPYFVLLFLILFISLFKSKIGDKWYLRIIFIILTIFVILKDYRYFPDHDFYIKLFNYVCENGLVKTLNIYSVEKGYILYNFIISLFTKKYFNFLIVTSIISLLGSYIFIKNNSKKYFTSVFVFLIFSFGMNFYVLRGALAFSFVLMSIKYLKEKQLLKYILLILLAGSFHKTTLIFIPLYFLLNINYNKTKMIYISILFINILLFKEFIVSTIINRFYPHYENASFESGGYLLLMAQLILFIYTLYKKASLINNNKNNNIFINMLMFSLFVQVFATVFGPINRITTYLLSSIIILIPELIDNIEIIKQKREFKVIINIIIIAIFIWKIMNGQPFFEYHLYI